MDQRNLLMILCPNYAHWLTNKRCIISKMRDYFLRIHTLLVLLCCSGYSNHVLNHHKGGYGQVNFSQQSTVLLLNLFTFPAMSLMAGTVARCTWWLLSIYGLIYACRAQGRAHVTVIQTWAFDLWWKPGVKRRNILYKNCRLTIKFKEIKVYQFVLFLHICVHTDKMLLEVPNIVKFTAFSINICLFLMFSALELQQFFQPLSPSILWLIKVPDNWQLWCADLLKARYKPGIN